MIAMCFPLMSCFIHEPLATCARNRHAGALHIIDAEFCAGVLPEVELGQIPIKMLLVHVLVDTNHATFEMLKKPS